MLISQQLTADAIQREGERAAAAASARHPLSPAELEAVAERARTALRFAKIGVLSQRERHAFNLLQARLFARHHRRPLFWWKQPLVGVAASYLTETETERAYLEERAGLCFHFVEGAPASITSNIETGRGLVNGCDAELHSLTLAGDTTLDNCLANTVWNDQYGIWEVQIEPPLSVNAIPDVSDEARQTARDASLFDEELVVPVLVGKASATYAPTSSWAARVGVPKELRINKHQIDLAFAVTDYKVSGCSSRRAAHISNQPSQSSARCRCRARRSITSCTYIVSLGKRGAGVYPKLKLVDLHVLVSRVRLGARLFVIGLNPNDVDHLRQLRPSEVLGIWEHGYNQFTEMWEPELAAAYAAERVASRRAAEAKGRKQKRPAGA